VLKKLPLHWIAGTNFKSRNEEPLPLALFKHSCICWMRGLEVLESAGRSWRAAMTSPSLTGFRAAVRAGLGCGSVLTNRRVGQKRCPLQRLGFIFEPRQIVQRFENHQFTFRLRDGPMVRLNDANVYDVHLKISSPEQACY